MKPEVLDELAKAAYQATVRYHQWEHPTWEEPILMCATSRDDKLTPW